MSGANISHRELAKTAAGGGDFGRPPAALEMVKMQDGAVVGGPP